MRDIPVVISGAGATKDCGGPLTNEILHGAFQADLSLSQQEAKIALVKQFLNDNFPLTRSGPKDYPSLPLRFRGEVATGKVRPVHEVRESPI